VASTNALMAQLPIIARSSEAAGAFKLTGGLLIAMGAFGCKKLDPSLEQR
jgi:hypothetical protein